MEHLEIVKTLCDNDFDTYVVGGGIRDMLLGQEPDDFDIVTEATPEEVLSLFKEQDVKEVGKSFGVILVDGYEVATFRQDNYVEKKCVVSFANTIHEDLSRRDLTINAMAYCELTGEIVDNHNGQADLDNKIVRFVGKPIDRIEEDPCRILRACRFAAKIDGKFSEKTLRGLRWGVQTDRIREIAPERIRLEVLKAMKIKNASVFFEALHEIGALKLIFPALDSCWEHEHGNHHKETVWEHCMIAGDEIQTKFPILKLAAYLHDCGKPLVFNPETKQFLHHESVGARFVKNELPLLKFSTAEIAKISGLIKCHMNSIQKMKPKTVRRFLKRLDENDVTVSEFFRIRMADRRANLARDPFTLREYINMVKRITHPEVANIPFNVNQLALKGGELIEVLDLTPGPIVSEIQNHLLNFVIERGPAHNTKQLLTVVAKRFLEER